MTLENPSPLDFLWFFPVFFAGLWLTVTVGLGFLSGWYTLAAAYPDREEGPKLTLKSQSGLMGLGVSMSGILILSACESGLRVQMSRIFGPFSRSFFVPWHDVQVQPRQLFFQSSARLGFGRPEVGVLSIDTRVWQRLSSAAGFPPGDLRTLPPASEAQVVKSLTLQWLVITAIAAAFYYFAPRLMGVSAAEGPPLIVCIVFPAIVFGVGQIIRYARQNR